MKSGAPKWGIPQLGFSKFKFLTIHTRQTKPSVWVNTRGGVDDIRFEAKAKDTKKIRGQGQPFRGQTLLRPRTGMLEAKAKDQGHKRKCSPKKKGLQKIFSGDLEKKKVFTKIFQAISTKKRFPKNFFRRFTNF